MGDSNGLNSRLSRSMGDKLINLENANAFNFTFSDSGLFGVKMSGAAGSSDELIE